MMGSSETVVPVDTATVCRVGGATTTTTATDGADLPKTSPFKEREIVLVDHTKRIYKAKILKVHHVLNEWRYLVHYIGWKKRWDDEVGTDRLMKYTEENLQKQDEYNSKQDLIEYKASRWYRQRIYTGASGKEQTSESVQKEKAVPLTEEWVHIPTALKKILVHDSECVANMGKLVKLPSSPNVDEVLSNYHDYRIKKDDRLPGSVGEVVNGLRRYFDKALPAMLLYKNERKQYEEAIVDNVAPSAVYGAVHLLRLFVKLPEILQNADIDETGLMELQKHLMDLMKFLKKNRSSFFPGAPQSTEISDSTIKKQRSE